MRNLEGDYKLNGFYLLGGKKGFQEGSLYFFPDGKAIGTVVDSNGSNDFGPKGPTPKKVLLGYLSPENELHLLKIPGVNQPVQDVIWALNGEKDSSKQLFKGGYDLCGMCGTRHAISIVPGLEKILRAENIPEQESLRKLMSGVESDVLTQRIFTKDIYDRILIEAVSSGQSGEIVLYKI